MTSDSMPWIAIGALVIVGYQIIRYVLPWLYCNVIGPKFFGDKVDLLRMGSWAVVTGATDGIGKAYAKALAKKGLNLVLISRSMEKLIAVSEEIKSKSNIEIKIVEIDFTGGPEIYGKIQSSIQDLDIGVLVNNVGMSYAHPDYFLDCVAKQPTILYDLIAVNIHSVTNMCSLVLKNMVAKKKGVIINISSTSAVIPNPLLTVYSATKAFVDKFSANLQVEYQDKGIIVQSIQPGFVATNMTKIRKPTLFAPSAQTYVEAALRTVGISRETAAYFPHVMLQMSVKIFSAVICEPFIERKIFNYLLNIRNHALKNLAKKN